MNQNVQISLREAAEAQLPSRLLNETKERLLSAPYTPRQHSLPADELLHELHVHQIELEMQNDELRRAHIVVEKMRDHYMNLYEPKKRS